MEHCRLISYFLPFFGVLLYYNTPYFSSTDERFGVELSGHTSEAYTLEQLQQLKETIVRKPQELLAEHDRILDNLQNGIMPEDFGKDKHLHPLFLLYECTSNLKNHGNPDHGKTCPLSRLSHPEYRAIFEQHVVGALEETYKRSGDVVNYVNLGAGFLFQDLVIVTQALEKNITKINIHLIDTMYGRYIEAITKAVPSRSVYDVSEYFDFEALAPDFENKGYVNFQTILHDVFRQFTNWFKTAYPRANVRIFLYDSVRSYILACYQKPEQKADVLLLCDPDGENFDGLHLDFSRLMAFTLRKDGVCLNVDNVDLLIRILRKPFESQVRLDKKFTPEDEEQLSKEGLLMIETKKVINLT